MAKHTRAAGPVSLEKLFHQRTKSIYDGQVKSVAQRTNKLGRITQVGRVIPYSLQGFQEWARVFLGPNMVGKCYYCSAIIPLETFQADHKVPKSRGGDLGLGNLVPCCPNCNHEKGKLTDGEFSLWLRFKASIPEAARTDLQTRLRIGGAYHLMGAFSRPKSKPRGSATNEQNSQLLF